MPDPSPIRDILQIIGEAVCFELRRGANEDGKCPLRSGSPLVASFAAQIIQGRGWALRRLHGQKQA